MDLWTLTEVYCPRASVSAAWVHFWNDICSHGDLGSLCVCLCVAVFTCTCSTPPLFLCSLHPLQPSACPLVCCWILLGSSYQLMICSLDLTESIPPVRDVLKGSAPQLRLYEGPRSQSSQAPGGRVGEGVEVTGWRHVAFLG